MTAPTPASPARDVLAAWARGLFLVGALLLPAPALMLGGWPLSDLAFFASLAMAALFGCTGANGLAPRPEIWAAFLLLTVGAGLAVRYSVDPSGNWGVWIRIMWVAVIWQWQSRKILGPDDLVTISWSLLVGGAASGLAGVAQLVGHLRLPTTVFVQGRASGLNVHPNGQGGTLAVVSVFGLALLLSARTPRLRAIAGALLLLCAGGIILAGSLTGLAATLVGVLALLLHRGLKLRQIIATTAVLLITYTAVVHFQSGNGGATPLERLSSSGGRTGISTVDQRKATDAFAWRRVQARPIEGSGLDAASGSTFDGVTAAHNVFLLAWFQGGLLVLVAYVLLLGVSLGGIWRARRRDPWAPTLLAALLAAIFVAQTGPVLFDRYFWLPVTLIAVLLRPTARFAVAAPVDDAVHHGGSRGVVVGPQVRARTARTHDRAAPLSM